MSVLPIFPVAATAEANVFSIESGQKMGRKNPVFSGQWNWGAFFMNWLWLMNHGRVTIGVLLLLSGFVPFAASTATILP